MAASQSVAYTITGTGVAIRDVHDKGGPYSDRPDDTLCRRRRGVA
jgi:hypothetical protein